MDEAGAVLDTLDPSAIVTYAEAGGWGRAIMLEARRRGIPSVGLQHGFIYRHWLNYLHEPDEMVPSSRLPTDIGFPRPTCTVLFDHYAEQHLRRDGRFPPEALRVAGSPRLDALVAAHARLSDADLAEVRRSVSAESDEVIVLMAAKYTQIRRVFRAVAEAAAATPRVRLVIKCHPAETPEPYVRDAAGLPRIVIAPASTDLAGLLAISRALITVNSTVALDALVLGIPALIVDLPNNLSPFVEAGVMHGAPTTADLASGLAAIIEAGPVRNDLLARRDAFLAQYGMGADGHAAERACDAILSMLRVERT
jgi:hypothetical protein